MLAIRRGVGVKKWSKLPTDSTKILQTWGRGVKNPENCWRWLWMVPYLALDSLVWKMASSEVRHIIHGSHHGSHNQLKYFWRSTFFAIHQFFRRYLIFMLQSFTNAMMILNLQYCSASQWCTARNPLQVSIGSSALHDGPHGMYLVKIWMFVAKKLSSDMIWSYIVV